MPWAGRLAIFHRAQATRISSMPASLSTTFVTPRTSVAAAAVFIVVSPSLLSCLPALCCARLPVRPACCWRTQAVWMPSLLVGTRCWRRRCRGEPGSWRLWRAQTHRHCLTATQTLSSSCHPYLWRASLLLHLQQVLLYVGVQERLLSQQLLPRQLMPNYGLHLVPATT